MPDPTTTPKTANLGPFTSTGDPAVDAVLATLYRACRGIHDSERWGEENVDGLGGPTYFQRIQEAANAAARRLAFTSPPLGPGTDDVWFLRALANDFPIRSATVERARLRAIADRLAGSEDSVVQLLKDVAGYAGPAGAAQVLRDLCAARAARGLTPEAPPTPVAPSDDDAAFLRALAGSTGLIAIGGPVAQRETAERLRAAADRIQKLQGGLDHRCPQDVRFNLVHIADQAGKKHFFNALATTGELVTNLTRHLRDDVRAFAARPIAPERAPALRTEGEDAAVERIVAEFPDLMGQRPCRTNEQLRLALAIQREIQAARGPAPERALGDVAAVVARVRAELADKTMDDFAFCDETGTHGITFEDIGLLLNALDNPPAPEPERAPAEFMQLLKEKAADKIAAMSPAQRAEFERNAERIVQILQHDAPKGA